MSLNHEIEVDKLDRLLGLLKGKRSNYDGYIACCPTHDDKTPSLSLGVADDGRILVKCHAGCKTEDVVAAIGLTMRDLAPETTGRTPGVVTSAPRHTNLPAIAPAFIQEAHERLDDRARAYLRDNRMLSDDIIERYCLGIDERNGEGRLTIPIADAQGIYRDVRRWLRPEKRQENSAKILHYAKGYGDARLFPLDQIEHDKLVLVEGELDALAVTSHSIPTITATTGASTWPDALSQLFKGKQVTILMDADDAGAKGAQKRAESLSQTGVRVRVASWPVERPEGWDATDELREHGIESLRAILDAASICESAIQGSAKSASSPSGTSDTALSEVSAEINWPDPVPLPDALPAVDSFDYEMLPEVFRPWIEDIADRMQAPPDYAAVGAIVTLAAVVGRQVGIRPKEKDDWTVVPNLWGGIVGPPSSMKTPLLQETQRPLGLLEDRAREKHDAALQDYEAHSMVMEAEKKKAKDDVAKALKDKKDPYAVALQSLGDKEQPPTRIRYRTSDSSVEKLGELLNQNPRGLLVFRDELTGFLRMLDREGHEVDRAFYLEAWNGTGRFTFDRIGRGTIDIDAACVSILGGIQPGPLSVYMSRALRGGGGDDGLVQRFQLLVWPDPPATWKNVDRAPDAAARKRAVSVFEELATVNSQAIGAEGPDLEGDIPFLHFAPAAQTGFNTWRVEFEKRLREEDLPPIMENHLAKFRSLIPSLALLFHLADEKNGPVSEKALLRACAWGEYLESHARRIYAPALSPGVMAGRALSERIQRGDVSTDFTARDVYRRHWANLDKDNVNAGIELLEDLGWITSIKTNTGGHPRVSYLANPKVLEA